MLFLSISWLSGQSIVNVNPATNTNNFNKIKKVTYFRPDNGATIVQSSEANGVTNSSSFAVNVVQVEAYQPGASSGPTITLDYFNFEGVEIRNMNLNSSNGGVGVYENGTLYPANADFNLFKQKLKDYLHNANMRSMFYYDSPTNLPCNQLPPACTTQDFDIQFAYAFESNDYLLASERYGNSTFTVIPLDQNGNVIGDYVCYGCGGGGTYTKYDWNTGYAPGPYQSVQAQVFTVVPISIFNATGPIFGLRIFNGVDQADVKFYGLSDNSFTDNPLNPTVTGIAGNVYNDVD